MPTPSADSPPDADGAQLTGDAAARHGRHARATTAVADAPLQPVAPDVTVTAIVVAHNGARWIPPLARALASATRRPDRVLAVDTGSRDDTAAVLAEHFGVDDTIGTDPGTSFGGALAAALAHAGRGAAAPAGDAPEEWLWLLHDDCVPAPTALAELTGLLATAEEPDGIAIVGPKLRRWPAARTLLEYGVTISRSGRRETGLEPDEEDQGQHDERPTALAVSSAGMLVRRSAWDALDGFDQRLEVFRDDVDFGWRANRSGFRVALAPRAIMHHAQAATSGRRTIDSGPRRRHYADRRNALYVLLANLPTVALPLAYVRLTLGSLARAVGFAIGKAPGLAFDELAALLVVAGRPDRIVQARRARARQRARTGATAADAVRARSLLAPWSAQLQRGFDAIATMFTRRSHGSSTDLAARGHRAAGSSEPGADDDAESLDAGGMLWLRRLGSPSVLLTIAALLVAGGAAWRLIGGGRLLGGALLPAPGGAAALWDGYASAWHNVGLGSDAAAPPYLAALAGLATALFGNAPLAVDVLMLGSVPITMVLAYVALGRLRLGTTIRVWAAATYGLAPATTGAIAGGRLGTVVGLMLLPLFVIATARAAGLQVGGGRPGPRAGTWAAAWTSGLVLSVIAAFVPIAYVTLGALVVAGALAIAIRPAAPAGTHVARAARRLDLAPMGKALVILGTPVVALLPWSLLVPGHVGLLLLEAGLPGPDLSDPRLAPLSVLLQAPGGPGAIPAWLGIPLLAGAVLALLRRQRRAVVFVAWVVIALAAAVGIAMSLTTVSTPTTQTPVAAWPGFPAGLVIAGSVVAIAVAGDRLRERVAAYDFGWRQVVSVVVVAAITLTPLVLAGWWLVRGADTPLERRDPVVLPEFVVAQGSQDDRPRTIVLRRAGDGSVTYALLRSEGPRIGDAEIGTPTASYEDLDGALADLVSGRGSDRATDLAAYAVRYLLIAPPVDDTLVATLDAVPTLRRLTTSNGSALWEVDQDVARLRLESADGTWLAAIPSGPAAASATIPPGPAGRVLVLAERADPRWTATLSGDALAHRTVGGWAQGFAVPAAGGQLDLTYDGSTRQRWLTVQAVALVVIVILALPSARRRELEVGS